jgi:hypothetical protein
MNLLLVKVVFGSGVERRIHLLRDTSILAQFHDYQELNGYRFIYDGQLVSVGQTPNQLHMPRGTIVDAVVPI